jgi:hypothetical protein
MTTLDERLTHRARAGMSGSSAWKATGRRRQSLTGSRFGDCAVGWPEGALGDKAIDVTVEVRKPIELPIIVAGTDAECLGPLEKVFAGSQDTMCRRRSRRVASFISHMRYSGEIRDRVTRRPADSLLK